MKKVFILLLMFMMSGCMTPKLQTEQRTVFIYDDVYHRGYPRTYYGYPLNSSLVFILESKQKRPPVYHKRPHPHRSQKSIRRGR